MIDALSNNLLSCFIVVCGIWVGICALLAFVAWITVQIYWHLQMFLITYSNCRSQLGHFVNRKMLILNYRVFRRVYSFLKGMVPFYYEFEGEKRYLELRIVSYKWKDTVKGFFCSGIVAAVLHYGLKYRRQITDGVAAAIAWGCKIAVFEFFTDNWVIIVTILAIVLIMVRYCKDKYINNIIYQIQDDDLKKILNIHKNIFHNIAELRNDLRYNLETVLRAQKSKGIFMPLCWSMENAYSQFSYNEGTKLFEKYDGHFRSVSFCPAVGYREITEQLSQIEKVVDDYLAASPYYSLSAVNKYIRGLNRFDITSFSQNNNVGNLICWEYIDCMCNKFSENLNNMMCSDYSDETKIRELTDLLKVRSFVILSDIEKTIRVAIEMDEYIKHFGKALRLRARRKDIPVEDALDRMKP